VSEYESKKVALAELQAKTLRQIQVETAYAWAYRAWAAKQLSDEAKARDDKHAFVSFLIDAAEYSHEAVEHGALAEDDDVLADVRRIVSGG
jgi:hypothetical protein